jgi:hypothetical protein
MKIMRVAAILTASMALVLTSCTDSLPVSPGEQTVIAPGTPANLGKNGPIVHAVQGSTNGTFLGVYDKKVINTYAAHQYADGSVDGQYMINAAKIAGADKTWKWNGRVIFLKVYTDLQGYGKFAVIGGIETTGAYAGTYELFFVIDNGPGAYAQTAHSMWVGDDAAAVMEKGNTDPADLISELGIETTDRGNLRVY